MKRRLGTSAISTDILVIGGGAAGLTTAVRSAQLGLSVVLIEKNRDLGGTTALSIGSFSANGTKLQRSRGIHDSPDEHFADMGLFAGALAERDNLALRRVYADNCGDALHWLMSLGMDFFGPMPEPPHRYPRMHNVLPNAGAYIYHLGRSARKLGVRIVTATRASDLLVDGGRIVGANCVGPDGTVAISSSKAVVLAAGDFSSDPELKMAHLGPNLARMPGINPTSTGDGLRLGLEAGGHLINGDLCLGPELRFIASPRKLLVQRLPPGRVLTVPMRLALRWLPERVLRPVIMEFATSYLAPTADLFRNGAVLIDREGHGFADGTSAPWLSGSGEGFIVLDHEVARRFSAPPHFVSTAPGVAYAYIGDYRRNRRDIFHQAHTPGQLAAMIGVPVDALEELLTGTRGSDQSEPGKPAGPFIALGPVKSWVVLTEGGLGVDERMRVTKRDGSVIPGLMAAGSNGQGGLILEGHGNHVGWAVVSGLLAAATAAHVERT